MRHEFHPAIPNLADKGGEVTFSDLHSTLSNYELLINNFSTPVPPKTDVGMVVQPSNPSVNYAQRTPAMRSGAERNHVPANFKPRSDYVSNSNPSKQRYTSNRQFNPGQRRSNNNGRSFSQGSVQCQICHRYNHSADTCRQRYNHASSPSANVASFYSGDLTDAWFPDTGATHHATPDLQSLDHAATYSGPDNLRVGNGKGSQNEGSTSSRAE